MSIPISAGIPAMPIFSITGPPISRMVFRMLDRSGLPKNFSHRSMRSSRKGSAGTPPRMAR